MLARGRLTHSYPHSWRSKAPLIFRNTPQWFAPSISGRATGRTLWHNHPGTGAASIDELVTWTPQPGATGCIR